MEGDQSHSALQAVVTLSEEVKKNGKELLLKGKYFMLILISTKDYSVLKLSVFLN